MSTDTNQNAQPVREVTLDDARYTLLGTAHVSRASVDAVRDAIRSGDYDAVAVELCNSRHAALTRPDALAQMDLFGIIRDGKAGMVAANLALGAYQKRLADQFGIEPGAEMRAAIEEAAERELPLVLIDREVGVTLRRVAANLSWFKRLELLSGLLLGLLSRDEITEEDVERLKQGDLLETAFTEFAQQSKEVYDPLISERDRYMAAKLRREHRQHPERNVLAVVGAGHLKGLDAALQESGDMEDEIRELDLVPTRRGWGRVVAWAIVALVISGFALGFRKSPELGWQMIGDWVLINGTLSALGAAIAAAHPVTILTAFLAAPLTSLNPMIGAGMVAAGVELWIRRPVVSDFQNLRDAVTTARGWWRNRVARTLLVFFFATLGSAIGTYLAGFRIFERLVS
jgi:pheromone shutdown-related protein TraB